MWFENDAGDAGQVNLGNDANLYYVGQGEFNPGEDISICKVAVALGGVLNDITGKTFYCQIWTMSGTSLGALQGESTGVIGVNAWDFSRVAFEFSTSVNLSNGTDYCIVVTMKEVDSGNYAKARATNAKTGFDGGTGVWNLDKTRKTWYQGYDFMCDIYTD